MAKRKRRKSKSGNSRTLLLLGCFALLAFGIILMMRQSPESTATTPVEEYTSSDNNGIATPGGSKGHAAGSKHYPGLEYVELPEKLTSQIKEYAGFTISFNKDNRTPNYVAWELLDEETNGEKGRSNNFWSDPDIEGCPTTADYTRSGYDRGHMCPSGDQKWSHEAMNDCFVMAN
ncbi:MAG: DNA/RNA non-specific endonuclease, partial [Muribaculaceae bacterium]|nr:DNA/RNA non-specific endonuclease [Muribaculaceae bacterium]